MTRTPSLSVERTPNGKVALVVRNATASLRPLLDRLGIVPDCTITNRRAVLCSTPAELDAAREPLRQLFDARGQWVGAREG
jgi:hypothetical protein